MKSVWWIRELTSTKEYLFFRALALSYQNTDCFSQSRESGHPTSTASIYSSPLSNWLLKMCWSWTVWKADFLGAHETTCWCLPGCRPFRSCGDPEQSLASSSSQQGQPQSSDRPSDQTRHEGSLHSPLFFCELHRPKNFRSGRGKRDTE